MTSGNAAVDDAAPPALRCVAVLDRDSDGGWSARDTRGDVPEGARAYEFELSPDAEAGRGPAELRRLALARLRTLPAAVADRVDSDDVVVLPAARVWTDVREERDVVGVEDVHVVRTGDLVCVLRRSHVTTFGTPRFAPAPRAVPVHVLRPQSGPCGELRALADDATAPLVAAVVLKAVCDDARSVLERDVSRFARTLEQEALAEAEALGTAKDDDHPAPVAPVDLLRLRGVVSDLRDRLATVRREAPWDWAADLRHRDDRSWLSQRPADAGKRSPELWRHLAVRHLDRARELSAERTTELTMLLQAVAATMGSLHAVAQARATAGQQYFQSLVSRAAAIVAVPSLVLALYGADVLVPGKNGKAGTLIVFVVSVALIGLIWGWAIAHERSRRDPSSPKAQRAGERAKVWGVSTIVFVVLAVIALAVAVIEQDAKPRDGTTTGPAPPAKGVDP